MSLRKGTPGEGGQRRHEHFSYTPTEAGGRPWTAWVAAEPYWCLAHPSDTGTKPCTHWITEGEMQCVRCRPMQLVPWVGYLGVWREADLKACLVVLREHNSELSENLSYGDYVIVSREGGEGNAVCVRRSVQGKKWQSKKRLRQAACDLTPSLLTLWKLPALTAWYEAKHGDSPVSLPQKRSVAVKDDGTFYAPDYQEAAKRAGAQTTSDPAALAEYDRVLAKFKDRAGGLPSKNGKHGTAAGGTD